MPVQQSETINMTACACDEVLAEFQITFRFDDKANPTSAIVRGVEVPREFARILFEAITGTPVNRH